MNINEGLTLMVNRVIDSVYLVCAKNKISYKNFCDIIDDLEDRAFSEMYKNYGTRPYKKRDFLHPVISENNSEGDFKEYINRVSLSLSDMLSTLEFHRKNISQIKSSHSIYIKFFEVYKKNLDNITSVILTQQDILLDILQSVDENEIQEKLEAYLDSAE